MSSCKLFTKFSYTFFLHLYRFTEVTHETSNNYKQPFCLLVIKYTASQYKLTVFFVLNDSFK